MAEFWHKLQLVCLVETEAREIEGIYKDATTRKYSVGSYPGRSDSKTVQIEPLSPLAPPPPPLRQGLAIHP